jgi:hypothetical protein
MNPPPAYAHPQHLYTPQASPLLMNNVAIDGTGTINPATLNPAGKRRYMQFPKVTQASRSKQPITVNSCLRFDG